MYTDENEAYTDSSGFFELDSAEDEQKTAELRGKYLRVYNESGTDGRLRFTGATAEWTTEAATQGEIDYLRSFTKFEIGARALQRSVWYPTHFVPM